MTSDGGGWTAVFAGRNGSTNVFDHFDTGYAGTADDPGTRYLRRAPGTLHDGEFAVSCASAMVKFPVTAAVLVFYFVLVGSRSPRSRHAASPTRISAFSREGCCGWGSR